MQDGRLCYLDFGMMGRLEEPIRLGLIRATLHLVNQEFDLLADDYVSLGLLPKDTEFSQTDIIAALTGALPCTYLTGPVCPVCAGPVDLSVLAL